MIRYMDNRKSGICISFTYNKKIYTGQHTAFDKEASVQYIIGVICSDSTKWWLSKTQLFKSKSMPNSPNNEYIRHHWQWYGQCNDVLFVLCRLRSA